MINFCCVLYGTKYPVEYAQNLYNMVKRHLTSQHKFYIFTDNVRLKNIIQGDVIVQQFPLHDMKVGGTKCNYLIQIMVYQVLICIWI